MKTITQRPIGLKALSAARQATLGHIWDKRLTTDPLVFIPKGEKAKGLSPTEARKANVLFGKFAANYMKKIIARLTDDSDVHRRQKDDKKIVAVGYGRGYDSKWLRQATKAGFQTWWIDVSSVAWIWATENLRNQFQAIPHNIPTIHKEPHVRTFEIQSLLAEPRKAGLDVASVEIWFLCRLLNCLSTRSAKAVLQEIGRTALGSRPDPHKRNVVVIINALSDHNPSDTGCGGASIVRSKKMILANMSHGATRPVEPRFVQYYQYFGKLVTAMTIMAQ